jgi:hypothetical protein
MGELQPIDYTLGIPSYALNNSAFIIVKTFSVFNLGR